MPFGANLTKEQTMNDKTAYSDRLTAMLPSGALDLVKTAARRECRKPSEWVRHAVLRQLEADGFCLLPDGGKRAA
jgi:hypothetical protein